MNVALHPKKKKKKNPYIFCVDMTQSTQVAVTPRIVTRPYGTTTRSFDPDNDISSPTRIGCLATNNTNWAELLWKKIWGNIYIYIYLVKQGNIINYKTLVEAPVLQSLERQRPIIYIESFVIL